MSSFLSALSQPTQGRSRVRFLGNKNRQFEEVLAAETTDRGSQNYSALSSRTTPDAYLQELLSTQCPPDQGPIVELGCNRGNNLIPLAETGHTVFGIDLDKGVLKDLNRDIREQPIKNQIHLARWDFGEAGDLPWQGEKTPINPKGLNLLGKVQAFYSVHVLSHFSAKGLEKTIQGLKQFLAPGGLFIATILQKSGKEYLSGWPADTKKRYGGIEHSEAEIQKVFAGLEETPFSRPFKPGELDKWILPEEKIHWRIFRKPVS
jgi:SAM-dependent methyltransferase